MNIEQKLNYQLNKYPGIKKAVKRGYQLMMYAISPKIKSEGNIERMSPIFSGHDYLFGYYDKSPWDKNGENILCLRTGNAWKVPDPVEQADILIINLDNNANDNWTEQEAKVNNKVRVLAITHTWNVQQGCMAQWIGPDFSSHVLYNDMRDGKYCSVIVEVKSGEERVLPMPVYTVSADGKTALTLDFSRLHNLRPGYGYAALPEKTKGVALPDETCIWKMDIESGEVTPLLKYTDFAKFQPRPEMQEAGSVHKVNHLMLSPNGKRFMVLYRWYCGQRKYTRLITCNIDGTDMYLLSDDDMVSHCYWKDDEQIIAFENKHDGGTGYYLMRDKSQEFQHLWPQLSNDGHPSYCPTDNSLVVFDTYPDRARIQEVKIARDTDVEGKDIKVLAKVFAPFMYDNDTRCDLHPRWSRDGKKICFDACFEGHRGMYIVNID